MWIGMAGSWLSRPSRPRTGAPPPGRAVPRALTAAGEDDAPVHDVAGELRRGLVERRLDRVDDLVDRFLDRLADLLGAHDDRLGQTGDEVAAADLGVRLVGGGERRPDRHLDLLSR